MTATDAVSCLVATSFVNLESGEPFANDATFFFLGGGGGEGKEGGFVFLQKDFF